jgi:hypothetical protein
MKKYIIVSAYSIEDLEIEVNEKLAEGYELVGGVAVYGVGWTTSLLQSMCKTEEK